MSDNLDGVEEDDVVMFGRSRGNSRRQSLVIDEEEDNEVEGGAVVVGEQSIISSY